MKKIITIITSIFLVSFLSLNVAWANNKYCYDDANLLSNSEVEQLETKINALVDEYDFDIFIVTVDSLNGKTSTEYADDFYDENYQHYDGILLLISMENRDWALSTSGFGIDAFSDAGQVYLVEQFKPYLSDGDYYEAFDTFVDFCDDFINQAKTDEPYDSNNLPKGSIQPLWILIAVIIGCVVSLLIMLGFKAQLKTVRSQPFAGDYVQNFKLTQKRDLFLYHHLTKTRKPDKESGSSTHVSSSGNVHGGSSGHF